MNPTIAAAVEASKQKTLRLKEIGKALSVVDKAKGKILAEEGALQKELASLTGSPLPKAGSGLRKARNKVLKKSAGRPAGSKNKTKSKTRGGSETGETRETIMLRTMPTATEGAIKKTAINALLEKAGYKSKAADPIVGVGQSLNRMSKAGHVTNKEGERGEWCLSKSGVKSRDKAVTADVAAAAA